MANFFQILQRIADQGVSVLNGAVGDKLQNTPLGIEMNFYEDGAVVSLDKDNLSIKYQKPDKIAFPKICLLIHGLTHNETAWEFKDKSDYGSRLAQDLQYTPFYLRYNTGLHISDNGKSLAAILEKLYQNYPIAIEEICIIAHSMGGLLTHSACHYAQESGLQWVKKVKNIFLLATPHLGSYLERLANIVTNILEQVPNWQTRLVGKAINLRSAGIKDLRFGYIREDDWKNKKPDEILENNKIPIQKRSDVSYYVISGRLTQEEKHWISQLFGDILVSTESATARSKNEDEFNFSPENHHEFANTDHIELSTMPEVYEKIKNWLNPITDIH
jgi:pimeloyl-ACP methyl ester carboxylesterase